MKNQGKTDKQKIGSQIGVVIGVIGTILTLVYLAIFK